MKIAIAGGTGFVGKALTKELVRQGHEVLILTRNVQNRKDSQVQFVQWLGTGDHPEEFLEGTNVFINLSGESLNSGRWTEQRKERIYNSRIHATREIVRIISSLKKKPSLLLNASAVGFYGISNTATYTEEITEHGRDFLGETVWCWEEEAKVALQFGVRVVFARFGVIFGKREGALPKMVLPYKLFAGGTVASGNQWLSWVHLDDAIGMLSFAINHEEINGPFNIVAPTPVKMKEFGQCVGKILQRPHWLPVPSFVLKLTLGEMSILVVEGQRVLPKKAVDFGYKFLYSSIDEALQNILKS